MIRFKIDVTEIEELAKAAPKMAPIIDEELEAAMNESGMLLTTMVAARTPVNFGILRSSIQFPTGFEVRGMPGKSLEGKVKAAATFVAGSSPHDYANYVEFGTRPHWPPAGPIELWVIRKLQPPANEVYAVVRGVQRAIAARGTEGVHMFRRAWQEGGKEQVERIFSQVPVKAIKRWEGAIG